jgi:hypothetical protein
MVAIHSSFYKGSKIRVIWHDGSQLITKFIDKLSDRKIRTSHGDLVLAGMRSCNYYKPHPHERI